MTIFTCSLLKSSPHPIFAFLLNFCILQPISGEIVKRFTSYGQKFWCGSTYFASHFGVEGPPHSVTVFLLLLMLLQRHQFTDASQIESAAAPPDFCSSSINYLIKRTVVVFCKKKTPTGTFMKTPTPTTLISRMVGVGVLTNISCYIARNIYSTMKKGFRIYSFIHVWLTMADKIQLPRSAPFHHGRH